MVDHWVLQLWALGQWMRWTWNLVFNPTINLCELDTTVVNSEYTNESWVFAVDSSEAKELDENGIPWKTWHVNLRWHYCQDLIFGNIDQVHQHSWPQASPPPIMCSVWDEGRFASAPENLMILILPHQTLDDAKLFKDIAKFFIYFFCLEVNRPLPGLSV